MNNQNLRKIIDSERQKCESDIVYFAKTFCKIEHPIKGKIPFNLFDFQSNTLSEFLNHRFNIVLKSRQMGISTLCAMFGLHQMLFKENFKILIIATKADVAKNLVRKVQIMYDNLPIWLRSDIKIKNNNKHSLWLCFVFLRTSLKSVCNRRQCFVFYQVIPCQTIIRLAYLVIELVAHNLYLLRL